MFTIIPERQNTNAGYRGYLWKSETASALCLADLQVDLPGCFFASFCMLPNGRLGESAIRIFHGATPVLHSSTTSLTVSVLPWILFFCNCVLHGVYEKWFQAHPWVLSPPDAIYLDPFCQQWLHGSARLALWFPHM